MVIENFIENSDTSFYFQRYYARLENYNAYLTKKLFTHFLVRHLGLKFDPLLRKDRTNRFGFMM